MLRFTCASLLGLVFTIAGCGSGGGATSQSEGGGDALDGAGGGSGATGSDGAEVAGNDAAADTDGLPGTSTDVGVDGGAETGAADDVVIIRGDPARTFATPTLEARGWGAEYEGRLVGIRFGLPERPPERLTSGRVRFHQGGFRIALPMAVETSLYKAKFLFVDVDGDGVCSAQNDVVYQDYSFLDGDLTLVLDGSTPAAMGAAERTMPKTLGADVAAQVCGILNGPWPAN
jgi:hypothetical protein